MRDGQELQGDILWEDIGDNYTIQKGCELAGGSSAFAGGVLELGEFICKS